MCTALSPTNIKGHCREIKPPKKLKLKVKNKIKDTRTKYTSMGDLLRIWDRICFASTLQRINGDKQWVDASK